MQYAPTRSLPLLEKEAWLDTSPHSFPVLCLAPALAARLGWKLGRPVSVARNAGRDRLILCQSPDAVGSWLSLILRRMDGSMIMRSVMGDGVPEECPRGVLLARDTKLGRVSWCAAAGLLFVSIAP